jgi:hypothetical protein
MLTQLDFLKSLFKTNSQFSDVLEDVMSHGGALLNVFHTGIDDIGAGPPPDATMRA